MTNLATGTAVLAVLAMTAPAASAADIVHDAEYYILEAQNGEKWAEDDRVIDEKLAAFREKNGGKPPKNASLFFTIFQTFMTGEGEPVPGGWFPVHAELPVPIIGAERKSQRLEEKLGVGSR